LWGKIPQIEKKSGLIPQKLSGLMEKSLIGVPKDFFAPKVGVKKGNKSSHPKLQYQKEWVKIKFKEFGHQKLS